MELIFSLAGLLLTARMVSGPAVAATLGWAFDGALRRWLLFLLLRNRGLSFDEAKFMDDDALNIAIAVRLPYFTAGVMSCPTCMSWWLGVCWQSLATAAWVASAPSAWLSALIAFPVSAAAASVIGLDCFNRRKK